MEEGRADPRRLQRGLRGSGVVVVGDKVRIPGDFHTWEVVALADAGLYVRSPGGVTMFVHHTELKRGSRR